MSAREARPETVSVSVSGKLEPGEPPRVPPLFAQVPKKFFTDLAGYENKAATRQEVPMMKEIADTLARSRATVLEDLAGLVALFVMLYGALSLTGAA